MELIPAVQKYDWGKPGNESVVAILLKTSKPDLVIDGSPFAELWMGTHPSGPSVVKETGVSLSELIQKNKSYLGDKSREKFGDELPFLFKVLSVNKALSIQAHPSKSHAEELHAKYPDIYKDPNHKPELAIALTDFKALCGFRPGNEIQDFLKVIPELREVVGPSNADSYINSSYIDSKNNIQMCFKTLMTCNQEVLNTQLNSLLKRFASFSSSERHYHQADLIETLYSQFPNDVGCFAPYFFNVVDLKPGEAIFLGPNEPHAYLKGDCIECMACSDNVVRAGLTPKFKDVVTLTSMLDYEGAPAEKKIFAPVAENKYTVVYHPPVPDFAVAKITVPKATSSIELIKRNVATILLCVNGSANCGGINLLSGTVVFIPANDSVEITDVRENLCLYQAMANV